MTPKRRQGQLIVLSGPSGVGKSTVISELLSERPDIYFSISFTTRQPRVGEEDGVNYNFVSKETFEGMIARDEFLEHARYVDNYYGTSLKVIREKIEAGVDVLLDIEVQGAAKVKKSALTRSLFSSCPPPLKSCPGGSTAATPTARRSLRGGSKRPGRSASRSPTMTFWWSMTRYPTPRPRSFPFWWPRAAGQNIAWICWKEFEAK